MAGFYDPDVDPEASEPDPDVLRDRRLDQQREQDHSDRKSSDSEGGHHG